MGWIEFIFAMTLFMASHRIPAALGVKDRLTRALGPRMYTFVFSLLSLGLLGWVIVAAGRAPVVTLWDQTAAARWGVNIAMPLVTGLSVFGIAAPNPFAFEGRKTGFEPTDPGVAGVTRQPLLWALLLWSGAHLWANGTLAHVILFGSFAIFSAIGMAIVEGRLRKTMGAQDWAMLTAHTGMIPFAAWVTGRWTPRFKPAWGRLVLSVASWGLLWLLHAPVIGVYPAP